MNFLKQLILLTASMLILLAASGISIASDGGFGGGSGSLEDPFLIEDAADFKAIQKNLSAHYKLVNNIDLSGSDLKPIGNQTNPFKGSLTGGSGGTVYKISNFEYIVNTDTDPIGLFGWADNARFSNLALKNIVIEVNNLQKGGFLAGVINNTEVVKCTVTDSELSGFSHLGLIGHANNSVISNCLSKRIQIEGDNNIGGILGSGLNTKLINCHSDGTLVGTQVVGGSVGSLSRPGALIDGSSSSCTIRVDPASSPADSLSFGGLAGLIISVCVTDSFAEGDIEAVSTSSGGLVGSSSFGDFKDCYATGDVISTKNSRYVGGLIGNSNNSSYLRCFAEGTVEGVTHVGGLIGNSYLDTISQSSVSGTTEVRGFSIVGGLIGHSYVDTISQSSANGTVEGTGGNYVGGLIGSSSLDAISECAVTADVQSTGSYVGGLVGRLVNSSLSRSFMTGDISGNNNVGGLAGSMNINASYAVSDCYVTGDVLGTGSSVGGLVGDFYKGEIKNSLALNEFVKGSTDVGRIYGLKTDGTLSDTCAWINMSDGSGHFKDGETNVTSVKVWRKYPSSGWATSGFGGDWELNTYGDFLLPVHAWTDKNVAADAAHLIPKYSITYDGNGHTSGTVPVDGTAYLDRFAPAAAILSDAGDMEMENLVFNGWNTAADGSGTAYAAGASLLMDSDMTLYAQWKVPSTPGGGSGTGSAAVTGPSGSATVTDPSDSAPVADPVQPGYETPVEPEPIPEIIVILFFMIAFACYLFVTRAEIEKENG